ALANTPQITFEVTDACNLKCTYCAYGDIYSDYDERKNNVLSTQKAITFLDYLKRLWESPLNKSYKKDIYVSFYGGEPLLNMHFIEKIVDYINNELNCRTRVFTFSITTNATLLNKYMDYLVQKNFNLLISLDGDEAGTAYRIDLAGHPAFKKITDNVNLLREKYPEYFEQKVNFSSVLHNLNSVEGIYTFFKNKYNKNPIISELNDMGVRREMKVQFLNIYNNSAESLRLSKHSKKIEEDMFMKSGAYYSASIFLQQYNEFVYKDYNELLLGRKRSYIIPTGTCIPFGRKVYVTVNGKILPCERVDHKFALGQLSDNSTNIDFEYIAKKYNNYYKKLDTQCKSCYNKQACSQCIFYIPDIDQNKVACHRFMSKEVYEEYRNNQLAFFANHPDAYYKIMTEVIVK
ncbi:radical SAM peptide maturase, partial [Dysgonomonas sp. OttesenSCG-928-D17]|nr:radical SAM peptide maturase [Dysgonomonas sp. OttesenSCG-928-D17]